MSCTVLYSQLLSLQSCSSLYVSLIIISLPSSNTISFPSFQTLIFTPQAPFLPFLGLFCIHPFNINFLFLCPISIFFFHILDFFLLSYHIFPPMTLIETTPPAKHIFQFLHPCKAVNLSWSCCQVVNVDPCREIYLYPCYFVKISLCPVTIPFWRDANLHIFVKTTNSKYLFANL